MYHGNSVFEVSALGTPEDVLSCVFDMVEVHSRTGSKKIDMRKNTLIQVTPAAVRSESSCLIPEP